MPKAPKAPKVQFKFSFQPAQKRLFQYVERNGGYYLHPVAPQCLEWGGIRSGKTCAKLVYYIQNYCMKFSHCDILVLRRTFSELESGVIQDFKTFVPRELYEYNQQAHVAIFTNGSRCVFAGCVNNKERDIEKYLGQSYPGILVDECGQFSPNAWELLYSRNTVNAACQPDEYGNFPIPSIAGCTNPLGPYWEYYHSLFVLKEPWNREEGCRRAKDGSWWAPDAGTWRLIYNPADYASNQSTVLHNPAYIRERDPGIVARLKMLPKAKIQKYLLGLADRTTGQYFDCFSEEQHVIDLREDPEAVIWQDWQPVWGGQDYGVGHWNAAYLFTKALVRNTVGSDYTTKTVCFAEIAPETTGQTNIVMADLIAAKAFYPRLPQDHPQYERISGKPCKVRAIYFSHEKFNRVLEAHSPADDYSRLLRARGLPAVSRGTMDRIGSASFLYNLIKNGKIVILRGQCPGIILALPALQRNPDSLDDVLKVDSKADDRYDAWRLGLYGMLNEKAKPQQERDQEYADTIKDPVAKYYYLRKRAFDNQHIGESFVQERANIWDGKI